MDDYESIFTGPEIDGRLSSVGAEFDAANAYQIGALCVKDGVMYKKIGGAAVEAWIAEHWGSTRLAEECNQISDEISRLVTTHRETMIDNDLSGHEGQGLNTDYVWVYTDIIIRKGYKPTITFVSKSAGQLLLLFFSKNADGTFAIRHTITVTCVAGENQVAVDDITQIRTYDTYLGVYSRSGTLKYISVGETHSISRCLYADVGEATGLSGSYALTFAIKITAEKTTLATDSSFVVVDINGNGKYSDIYTAITSEPENTPLLIYPGIYSCSMTACLQKRIILLGTDRSLCIIRDTDGRYGHHPLYVSCGYFENLTIESAYVSGTSHEIGASDLGSYAVHIDTDNDYAVGKTTEFHHCTIRSDFFPAVGMGLRKDARYIFDDCGMENAQIIGRGDYSDNGSLGALYFHNTNGVKGDQYITIKDCVLISSLGTTMTPYQTSGATSADTVHCIFVGNVLRDKVNGYDNNIWMRGDPFNPYTGRFVIDIGFGNSNNALNN